MEPGHLIECFAFASLLQGLQKSENTEVETSTRQIGQVDLFWSGSDWCLTPDNGRPRHETSPPSHLKSFVDWLKMYTGCSHHYQGRIYFNTSMSGFISWYATSLGMDWWWENFRTLAEGFLWASLGKSPACPGCPTYSLIITKDDFNTVNTNPDTSQGIK